jgi:ATP-binding cassette, subfamily B, bacterial
MLRRFFAAFVRPYFGLQVEIGACLVIGVVLGLVDPLVLRAIIDRALGDGDRQALYLLSGLLVLVLVFRVAFRLLSVWLYSYSGLRILFDVRSRLFEHVERLSPYFFRGERYGDILSRLTSDVDVLQQAAAHTLVNAASDILSVVGILALLLWLDPVLTGALVLAYPLLVILLVRLNRDVRDEGKRAREAYGDLFSFLEERLTGIRLVQEHLREKAEARGHVRVSRPLIRSNLALSMFGAWQVALSDLLNTGAFVLVFLAGGSRVLSGALSVGSLVAYYTLASRLLRPIGGLIEVNVDLQVARASLARIFELLDQVPEIREEPGARAPGEVRGGIALKEVRLGWPDGTPALEDVSLEIPAGSVVALVGPSGGGKSTLAALLPRYLDPHSGNVLLDGRDVRGWPLKELRRRVGLVPQETQIFHDTLEANLRLASSRASEARLLEAIDLAGLGEFVRSIPEGLKTPLGEHGLRLSGGERQRLALARVLLKDPGVYVLDEATSALDPRTERQVLERFLDRVRGRTVILIAHRLTSLVGVDRIFVLSAGRIVASGTHEGLYRGGGLYRGLYDDQMRRGAEEAAP